RLGRLRGADVHDLDGGQSPTAHALREGQQMVLAGCRVHPALEAGRRTPKHDDRALGPRAHDGHLAGVIARGLALLVARLVLLVDDDRAEVAKWRKDRRSRTDGNPFLTTAEGEPGV